VRALERTGRGAEVKPPEPWEELSGDVPHITRAQHEAMKRGQKLPVAPVPALPPADDDIVAPKSCPTSPYRSPSVTETVRTVPARTAAHPYK
jgi:hypothetical protein